MIILFALGRSARSFPPSNLKKLMRKIEKDFKHITLLLSESKLIS
jgi:hypothetical protein